MSTTFHMITLVGGPPWGFRLTQSEDLRPLIGNVLPGGNAEIEGIRVGDRVESVNGSENLSTSQTHAVIQAAQGVLRLKLARNTNGRNCVSNSATPVAERREMGVLSAPSSPMFNSAAPRTNPRVYSPNAVRIPRLDVQFTPDRPLATTQEKRRLFEAFQAPRPSATDSLLKKKIAMGLRATAAASEDGLSNFSSNLSGSGVDNVIDEHPRFDRPIYLIAPRQQSTYQPTRPASSLASTPLSPMASSVDSPGPSWSQRSETPVGNGSVGSSDIEIPGRRSVAAIREEIANKLEVKGPSGPPSGTARPTTPKSSVLLQRLLEDQKPSPLGKVVDKPPSGANFYQGVPPPSYCQPSYPAQTSPSKPLTVSIPSATKTLEDQMKEELKKAPLREDSPELTPMHLPQKYNEPKSEPSSGYSTGGSHDESNHSSKDKEDEEVRTLHNTVILHGPVTVQRGNITPVHFEKANVYGKNDVNAMKTQLSRELEVADPRTFSPYSSGSSDHYGTVRRRPRPTIGMATLEPALTSHTFSDSGYEVNSYATDTMRTNDSKTTEDSRSLLSTNGMSTSSYVPPPFTVGEVGPVLQSDFMLSRPDSLRSSVETPLVSPSEAGARHGGASVASSSEPRPASSLSETSSSRIAPSHGNTEMSAWYRNMFKRLHKLDTPEPSSNVLRYQVDAANTASTSGGIVNGRSRAEGSVTREERRAKSVGRTAENLFDEDVVDRWREQRRQLGGGGGRYALERGRTPHFHLPSFRLSPVGPGLRSPGSSSRTHLLDCPKCGRPKRDPSFEEIDAVYKELDDDRKRRDRDDQLHAQIALKLITDRLDSTAVELQQFIDEFDSTWKRSKSTPMLSTAAPGPMKPLEISTGEIKINGDLSKNFNDLKRETKEELLYKKQAEKLSEELDNQKSRRHGYIPTASPSLQTNFDRFTGLMQSYGDTLPRRSPTPHRGGSVGPTGIQICTAIYDFAPLNNRELGLNKGDIVRIHRYIDANWIEGERNGRIGIFPTSYVQFETSRDKLRAVYPFTARNRNEMSLKLGELVKFRREIDMNWIEGSNHLGEIGIFPRSYVRRVEEGTPEPGSSIPDRPKTPKLPNTPLDKVVNGFSNDLSTLSTTPISVNKASTSDHGGRVHEWQQKHDSAGYQGLAQAIPRGSQTYRVLYPYEPKNDDELELRVDDIVFVVEKCDDGWYIGTSLRTGLFGTFPGNFVERH